MRRGGGHLTTHSSLLTEGQFGKHCASRKISGYSSSPSTASGGISGRTTRLCVAAWLWSRHDAGDVLACGTPVVATSVGGIPEQIEDGVTGFLTPPGDAGAIIMRMELLLSDDALCQRFAAAAVESARRRFDLNRQVNDYLSWCQEIIAQSRFQGVSQVVCESS